MYSDLYISPKMILLAHNRPRAISRPLFALALVLMFIFLIFFTWWLKIRQNESENMKDTEAAQTPPTTTKELGAEEEEGRNIEEVGKLGVGP